MKALVILVLVCLAGMISCTISKDARKLKRSTSEWRQSPVVLKAYQDYPFVGTHLTLRKNGKFEHTSGNGIVEFFSAGAWTSKNDTITLYYLELDQKSVISERVIIDRQAFTVVFEADSVRPLSRFKIVEWNARK